MTALVIVFCAGSNRGRVAGALLTPDPPMLLWHDAAGVDIAAKHRPLHLLAVGPEGGASLARWVEAHGFEGAEAVGLVGVTAPWAERGGCDDPAHKGAPCSRPLPSIEPLRAAAERARVGEPVERAVTGVGRAPIGMSHGRSYPLHLVIACAPDDGVCANCKRGYWARDPGEWAPVCDCKGRGALSSKAVADELIRSTTRADVTAINHGGPIQQTWGGLTMISYPTASVLSSHGIQAALKALGAQ